MFSDIASTLRHEGQTARQIVKNCATKCKLSAFQANFARSDFDPLLPVPRQVIIHPDWLVLN